MIKLVLASKSKVRKEILDKNNIMAQVEPSNVDEDIIKISLLKDKASSLILFKYLLSSSSDIFFIVNAALSV